MQKKTGVHFYINIANFDDVAEKEEAAIQEVKHSIHLLDEGAITAADLDGFSDDLRDSLLTYIELRKNRVDQ